MRSSPDRDEVLSGPQTGPYPVICAWCGRILRYGPVAHSHGICRECARGLMAEFRREFCTTVADRSAN